LDFYCPEYKLGIEADGGQHYEHKGRQRDEVRTRELSQVGIEILRFSDREILTNIDGVGEIIQKTIEKLRGNSPHLNPLPRGRGGNRGNPPHLNPLPEGERR
jgi:very-short-patch-repair endonuclease